MLRRTAFVSLPALALGLLHCDVGAQATPSAPSEGSQILGVDYPAFDQVGKKIETNYPDVESVVVVRRGRVLFEHSKTSPDSLHDVQSVTKSVLSLAVGAAVSRGVVQSLDQPVGELLGVVEKAETRSPSPAVTLRHLLTMTAGYRTQERFARRTADDPTFLLQRERDAPPGSNFAYDNLSANLLAVALEAATGQSVSSFAEQAVFRPLGITAHEWEKGYNGHSLGFSGRTWTNSWITSTVVVPSTRPSAIASSNLRLSLRSGWTSPVAYTRIVVSRTITTRRSESRRVRP